MAGFNKSEDASYCADQVRLSDKDRYLSALYVPNDKRRYILALYAFYNEIAKIPELVTETTLGEIRFMWWHDAVADLYSGKTADQPLLRELSGAIEQGDLEKSVLLNFINTRYLNLHPMPFDSVQEFERYSYDTEGALIYLASRILLPVHAGAVTKTAREAGLAYSLTTCLCDMANHAARGMVQIPPDILAAHNVKREDLIAGIITEDIRAIFVELQNSALTTLERARDLKDQVPLGAMSAFLPISVVDLYLKAMTAYGYNPMRQTPRVSQLRRQWRIMRSAHKARF